MALPGQKIEEFESVFSHPMALLQCDDFLSQFHGMESIGKKDTASSAKKISDKKLMKTAAIGSKGAAEKFGLEIYASDIQTHKLNFTRFLIIGPQEKEVEDANKASIVLQLEDKPGSLQQVLETFTRFEINLTKIQSIPIIGKPYAYFFHFDLEWQPNTPWRMAIEEVKQKITGFKNLGVYKCGNRSDIVK
jgi:prephenate dehydratase